MLTPTMIVSLVMALQADGVRFEDKRSSVMMQRYAQQLESSGIVQREEFENAFAVTIYNTIFIPFTPGVESAGWSLDQQMSVIAHESVHVDQYRRLGMDVMNITYASSSGRAALEAEAYSVQMAALEITGTRRPASAFYGIMGAYAIRDGDELAFRAFLDSREATTRNQVAASYMMSKYAALRYVAEIVSGERT